MMKNNFTLKNYTELLQRLGKNHEYITFSEYGNKSANDAIILLRHDLDYSLKHALKMAILEADLGIKSTYFFLFSSSFYNILDEVNIQIATQIRKLGHEIGLHYDVGVIEKGNKKAPLSLLHAQANILGNITDSRILSITMHNPSTAGNDIFRNANYVNAYEDKFVKGMAYFSDSCMSWRNRFIEHLKLNNFPPKMQLLIHPIMWSVKELNRWDKLDDLILANIKEMKNKGEIIKELWRNHAGVIEHDSRILNHQPDLK